MDYETQMFTNSKGVRSSGADIENETLQIEENKFETLQGELYMLSNVETKIRLLFTLLVMNESERRDIFL